MREIAYTTFGRKALFADPLSGAKSQFKEYWLKELPGANYYEIRLLENAFLKENMDLSIDPEPDTLIRLNFYSRALSQKNIWSSLK